MPRILLLLLVGLLPGCSRGVSLPQTIPELRDVAIAARDEAQSSCEASDGAAAEQAAHRAELATQAAAELLQQAGTPTQQDRAWVAEMGKTAREARRFARWAIEKQRLAALTGGLKAKAYYGARSVAMKVVFKGLSLAAGQADRHGIEGLSPEVQESAHLAAQLARDLAGRARQEDGRVDWAGVAADLDRLSGDPPPEIGLLAGLAGVVLQKPDLALLEIENVDSTKLKTKDWRSRWILLRMVALSQNDMPILAIEHIKTEAALDGVEATDQEAGALAGMCHLMMCYMHLRELDLPAADLELAHCIRVWPDSPVTRFLTGEQLAASGDYEAAADSLETFAAGTTHEWLAGRIAERAREIRDHQGEARPLLTDPRFLAEFLADGVAHEAQRSPAAARAQESIDMARKLGARLLEHLPNMSQ